MLFWLRQLTTINKQPKKSIFFERKIKMQNQSFLLIIFFISVMFSTLTQSQQPHPTVTISMENPVIILGDESRITVTVINDGSANSDDGGITLSFPSMTNQNDTMYVRKIIGPPDAPGYQERSAGQQIYNSSCQQMTAQYLFAETNDGNWVTNETNTLTVGIIPKQTGSFNVYVRSAMHKIGTSCTYINSPSTSSYIDQQGWPVYVRVITVNQLTAPSLFFPTNGATVANSDVTLDWDPVSSVDSYGLQVRTSSGNVVNESGITNSEYTVFGLEHNKTYYWKVRSENGSFSSSWSSEWSFQVQIPPSSPVLMSPTSGSTILQPVTLAWYSTNRATYYQLQVSLTTSFNTTVYDESNITVTSKILQGFTTGQTHYWRVRASNSGGTSNWSSVWNFIVPVPPSAPALLNPPNGASISRKRTFSWNSSSGATSYTLQVDDNQNFSSPFTNTTTSGTSYLVETLLANTTYYWRVNATNSAGTSSWSTTWNCHTTTVVSIDDDLQTNPKNIEVSQNYPNPFNPVTNFQFQVPSSSFVTIKVYDILGNEIATLVNERKEAGNYSVQWNAETYPSGMYFYQLTAGNKMETKKMILLK
ncbi:MAG: T9SS type A sorting domain-containing protein [Ignavibacteria bacterium]|nr:T9SS type A sorting domain-containing protein [Ignavibacteria bacterium]